MKLPGNLQQMMQQAQKMQETMQQEITRSDSSGVDITLNLPPMFVS